MPNQNATSGDGCRETVQEASRIPAGYQPGKCTGCGATAYPVSLVTDTCLYCEARAIACDREAVARVLGVFDAFLDEALAYVSPADLFAHVQERVSATGRDGAATEALLADQDHRNHRERLLFEQRADTPRPAPFVTLDAEAAAALREEATHQLRGIDGDCFDGGKRAAEERQKLTDAARVLELIGWPATPLADVGEYPLYAYPDWPAVSRLLAAFVKNTDEYLVDCERSLEKLRAADDPDYVIIGCTREESIEKTTEDIARESNMLDAARMALDRIGGTA